MSVSITSSPLQDFSAFMRALPDVFDQAMAMAINQVVDREGMTVIKRDMREQIDFPAGYLEQGRLKVVRKAGKGSLEAIIRGRDRATSIARFAAGQTPANTRGRAVALTVRRGQTKILKQRSGKPSAFLVNLRNGNTGLAVRLKPGQSLKHSQAAVSLANNVYLLYGPSVEQVFRGVAEQRSGDLGNMVAKQFIRQFTRLSNRG